MFPTLTPFVSILVFMYLFARCTLRPNPWPKPGGISYFLRERRTFAATLRYSLKVWNSGVSWPLDCKRPWSTSIHRTCSERRCSSTSTCLKMLISSSDIWWFQKPPPKWSLDIKGQLHHGDYYWWQRSLKVLSDLVEHFNASQSSRWAEAQLVWKYISENFEFEDAENKMNGIQLRWRVYLF